MRWIADWTLAVGAVALGACAGRLPHPRYVGQPTSALEEVGYPPPPARVEFVPPQPSSDAVYVDGDWQWEGRRWAWRPGRWVVPPKDALFSPWALVRSADGVVYFAQGTWRDAKHQEVAEPAPLATGQPNISDVVDPEGEIEKTGKTLRPSEGTSDAGPGDARADARLEDAWFEEGAVPLGAEAAAP